MTNELIIPQGLSTLSGYQVHQVKDPVYKHWKTVISNIYSNSTEVKQRATKRMMNTYMLTHFPGYKVAAFTENSNGFFILIRMMSEKENIVSVKYQQLYKETSNIDVLQKDPMWELEVDAAGEAYLLSIAKKQLPWKD